jgi:hypothetical protein
MCKTHHYLYIIGWYIINIIYLQCLLMLQTTCLAMSILIITESDIQILSTVYKICM